MNERQKEQQHVNETIALIHRKQAILSQQKQELAAKMDDQLKEIADKKIRGGDSEAFYESVIEYQQHEQELLIKYQRWRAIRILLESISKKNKRPRPSIWGSLHCETKMKKRSSLTGAHRSPIFIMKESLVRPSTKQTLIGLR